MNKLYLSSVLLAIFALPAFADIDKSASSATCNSATIGATSGTAYMDTDWTANTINLDFYSDGEKISTGSCTYDGTIELPNDPEDKAGYTFGGWQLRRAPAQTTFDLSTWVYGDTVAYGYQNDSTGEKGPSSNNTTAYGINGDQQWATEFENGTVRGIASCNSTPGNEHTWDNGWANLTGNIQPGDTFNQSSTGQYCWCKATGVDTEKDGTYQSAQALSWVFSDDYGNAADCADDCAYVCGSYVDGDAAFRSAMFGISE